MNAFTRNLILLLFINFASLALGGYLMGDGPMGEWYQSLNKAPWTPPGWVFGAAWTIIMICFSFFMAYVFEQSFTQGVVGLFALQVVLNIAWNPVFFSWHEMSTALLIISGLTLLIAYLLIRFRTPLGSKAMLILPYLIWLIIATSLNAYAIYAN